MMWNIRKIAQAAKNLEKNSIGEKKFLRFFLWTRSKKNFKTLLKTPAQGGEQFRSTEKNFHTKNFPLKKDSPEAAPLDT